MRLPIGTTGVSASGGTMTLIGRRGEGWDRIGESSLSMDDAIALLDDGGAGRAANASVLADAALSASEDAPRFSPGEEILWRYSRNVETARVVRDDARGLVVWIPSGSQRLESAPADGRKTRDVPLDARFTVPWVTQEATWTGPGLLRVAPTGKPWSVWFFRRADGTPDGAYVNLELPHRRVGGDTRAIVTHDLVLDLWIDAEHSGAEDVWLKDADELEAAVAQGRFTIAQADAVRSLADHAAQDFIASGDWPLDEGWDVWNPDAAMDEPVTLPASAEIDAARQRTGETSHEG